MKVTEIFYSLQGEGFLAGIPSVFIRLAGCPLRCRWCDTAYAWDYLSGNEISNDQILSEIRKYNCRHLVITGGEPMVDSDMQPRKELPKLTQDIKAAGDYHITIETAGIGFVEALTCDLMSISPKLSNAFNNVSRDSLANVKVHILKQIINQFEYQFKFVVDHPEDLSEIQRLIKEIGTVDPHKILLMTQATNKKDYLAKAPMVADLCCKTGYAFSQRLQIMLWDNKAGC
jgi:7-carboxy-7-deazaguanine synthase